MLMTRAPGNAFLRHDLPDPSLVAPNDPDKPLYDYDNPLAIEDDEDEDEGPLLAVDAPAEIDNPAPPPKVIVEEPEQAKGPMIWNYLCRWIENSKFLGAIPRASLDYREEQQIKDFSQPLIVDYDIQIGTLIGNGCGIILAVIFHFAFASRRLYKPNISLNPLYRNFKTLASLGAPAGTLLANVLPFLPKGSQKLFTVIFSDIFAIVFGLFAIPYWLYRENWLKTPAEHRNRYAKIGIEGWSKYAKTAIVLGMSLGQAIGAIVSFATGQNIFSCLAIGGGISALVCFTASVILVPLINKHFNNILISDPHDKDSIRNNYIRSGITLGLSLGAVIGFFLFPALGAVAGMGIGAAFCSVALGIVMGKYGQRISQYTKQQWGVGARLERGTDNSWDYATRNTSYACAFLFSVVGFFLPIPGGSLVGAALGSAVGGVVGWFSGLYIIKKARELQPVEQPAETVPWTQRIANGANVFSLIGAAVGFGIGTLLLGPLGSIEGATLGFAIGGFVGSICGALFDKTAVNILLGRPALENQNDQNDLVKPNGNAPLLAPALAPGFAHIPALLPPAKENDDIDFMDDEAEEDERNDAVEPSDHDSALESVVVAKQTDKTPSPTETAKVTFIHQSKNRYLTFQRHPVIPCGLENNLNPVVQQPFPNSACSA